MAKTLVIKGANFSANKVATVEFDRIHTTALSIEATASLDSIGATHNISYTITPSDSEDPILWVSSDETVCTVDDNGVVTATGCGTATITATSNGISDTCTVACEIVMAGFTRAPKTYIGSQSASGHAATADCYIGTTQTGYNMYMSMMTTDSTKTELSACITYAKQNGETGKYYIADYSELNAGATKRLYDGIGFIIPIKLPNNCASIKCVGLNERYAPYVMFYKSETRAADSDTDQAYFSAYKQASPTPNNYSWSYQQVTNVTVPDGYDSISVMWKADTANGAVDFASLTEEQIAQFSLTATGT